MANLSQYQDPTGGEVSAPRDALPPGDYVAALVKSDEKQTKDGSGSYIACEFEVMDGTAKGRRFWTNLNLNNRNAEAVEIAWRTLNSIKHACGRLNISDTSELHGIPMIVTLGFEKNDNSRNAPKSYKPMNGGGAVQQRQQGGNTSSMSSGQTGGKAPGTEPWKRQA